MRTVIAFLSGILVMAVSIPGARAADLMRPAEIQEAIKPLLEKPGVYAVSIALVSEAGTQFADFGHLADGDRTAPTPDTVYEIASLTKPFTGTLLADMVLRGQLKLDDTVKSILTPDVKFGPTEYRPITLLDLATHRSGLPRMPGNMKAANQNDPFADYTLQQLWTFLNKWKPTRGPGEEFEYSNLGFAVLGQAIARRGGRTYFELLSERVLRPLGMHDTSVKLSPQQERRLAPGHTDTGEPMQNWTLAEFVAGGGLRSTTRDMARFVAAASGAAPSSLDKVFAEAQHPPELEGKQTKFCLGWPNSSGGGMAVHTGQTGGYHTYMGIAPKQRVAVVILANTATEAVDSVGQALLTQLRANAGAGAK